MKVVFFFYAQKQIYKEIMDVKNIILFGAGRAGKSTLARKLNEELNYFVLSVDKFVGTLGRAYPQLGIDYDSEDKPARLAPFIGHFLGMLSGGWQNIGGNKFVLEGYFDFEKIVPIWNKYEVEDFTKHFLLIGLIYPNQTSERLFNDIRKHDKDDDWTKQLSDDELRSHVISSIEYSRNFRENFKQYNPIIYDVSNNREQILDTALRDIKIRLGEDLK